MTATFTVEWGGHQVQVATVEDLDEVLDRAERDRNPDGLPYKIDLVLDGSGGEFGESGLQLGLGHPQRAFLMWFGEPGGGLGHEAGLAPWTGGLLSFDYGGVPTEDGPERLGLSPAMARQAAREFLRTGQRPTCVRWVETIGA